MSKKFKSWLCITLVFMLISLVSVKALAAPVAHLWADATLPQSYNGPYYVGNALSNYGLSVTKFINTTFNKADFLNELSKPYVIYYSGHASSDAISTYLITPGGGYVYANDIKNRAFGHYNIIYFSACRAGETNAMANAFGITSEENEAFVGFKDAVPASWTQTVFDKTVFESLASGKNINDSVWRARTDTGITNYAIYGNYNATLEK